MLPTVCTHGLDMSNRCLIPDADGARSADWPTYVVYGQYIEPSTLLLVFGAPLEEYFKLFQFPVRVLHSHLRAWVYLHHVFGPNAGCSGNEI